MVEKVKEIYDKTRHVEIMINLKNTFYVNREMKDIMIDFYLIKRNHPFIF